MASDLELRQAAARTAHDALVDSMGPLDTEDNEERRAFNAFMVLRNELLIRGQGDGPDFFYDPEFDTLMVEGTAYAYDTFRQLGTTQFTPGMCFATVSHQNGWVHLRDIRPVLRQARELLAVLSDLVLTDEQEAARVRTIADIDALTRKP